METSAISYRVADFLKRHAPFNSVDDVDLLALAGGGRVRFHEPNEYILWQGEPHRYQVFVLQQGTVSLWDESAEGARLRDIRGAGDMLGIALQRRARLPPLRPLGNRRRPVRVRRPRFRDVRPQVPACGALRGRRGPGDA